jgi:hypothetical protein
VNPVSPLPVRVRLAHGESLDSYAAALARANHQSVHDIETALRAQGVLTSHARSSPQRKALWRALGALHARAFTAPARLHGATVQERTLCPHCAQRDAYGLRPDIGVICLTHRAWFGTTQPVTDRTRSISSERAFRRHVAPFAHTGSPIWRLAQECALTTTDPDMLTIRGQGTDIQRVYPETVAYARLILSPPFLRVLTNQDLSQHEMVRIIGDRVTPLSSGTDSWRAQTRLTDLSRDLQSPGGVEKWGLTAACEAAKALSSQPSSARRADLRCAVGPTAVAS